MKSESPHQCGLTFISTSSSLSGSVSSKWHLLIACARVRCQIVELSKTKIYARIINLLMYMT